MRRNLTALSQELREAITNWNEFTEDDKGNTILEVTEIEDFAQSAMNAVEAALYEEGKI